MSHHISEHAGASRSAPAPYKNLRRSTGDPRKCKTITFNCASSQTVCATASKDQTRCLHLKISCSRNLSQRPAGMRRESSPRSSWLTKSPEKETFHPNAHATSAAAGQVTGEFIRAQAGERCYLGQLTIVSQQGLPVHYFSETRHVDTCDPPLCMHPCFKEPCLNFLCVVGRASLHVRSLPLNGTLKLSGHCTGHNWSGWPARHAHANSIIAKTCIIFDVSCCLYRRVLQ